MDILIIFYFQFPLLYPPTPPTPFLFPTYLLRLCLGFVLFGDPVSLAQVTYTNIGEGLLQKCRQLSGGCTTKDNVSAPLATINCQWLLREGWGPMSLSSIYDGMLMGWIFSLMEAIIAIVSSEVQWASLVRGLQSITLTPPFLLLSLPLWCSLVDVMCMPT